MDDRELPRILGGCLDDIAGGATPSACLARYPQHAAELAPLLAAASEVASLSSYRLSDEARAQAKARLRQAEAARGMRQAPLLGWLRLPSFAPPRVAVGVVVALLWVILTTGIVAASQPGDAAYGVRVAVERIPALLAPTAEARARAELGITARRMADLDRTMSSQAQALDPRTLDALLASTEAAASLAANLPGMEHEEIAAVLAAQADRLAAWERSAHNPQQALMFRLASERMQRAAMRAGEGRQRPRPQPEPENTLPVLASTATVTRTPSRTATVTLGVTPRRATSTPTPQPAPQLANPTRTPAETPRHQQPTRGAERTTTPQRQGLGPAATSAAPEPTSSGPGPEPTSPGSGPEPTSPGPGSQPTSPGPGPQPTSALTGPRATSSGPGPDPTSPGNGPGGPLQNTPGAGKKP